MAFDAARPLLRALEREQDAQPDVESEDDCLSDDDLDELLQLASGDVAALLEGSSGPKRAHTEAHLAAPCGSMSKRPRLDTHPAPSRSGSHRRRSAKREQTLATQGHIPRPKAVERHVKTANLTTTDLQPNGLPTTSGAYVAKLEDAAELYGGKKARSLAEYLSMGFEVVKTGSNNSQLLVDRAKRVFGAFVAAPKDPTYAHDAAAAYEELEDARRNGKIPASSHRRGRYPAVNVVEQLLNSKYFKRLASFMDASFAAFAPKLHRYYADYNHKLSFLKLPRHRPFPASVFCAACFNFGPRVRTYKHRDILNLPFGWCAIISLGKFDATKGGHLVLWDLKLLIEFPPGSLILIPSATLAHSNVPIESHEHRASFTQFTAGGLFRFVDNDFRTDETFAEEDPAGFEAMLAGRGARWEMGLNLWSTVDELLETE
ncbi:hypothetical protein HMN09_00922800 [Mycena chlorophos]|uniref:Uncharacterized protein n=1 Tax=Mycena chlorophos TaxID=658473 RepID=A0A8H6W3I7_MYCCL|nr:hypothetical protein HMN09_00922800 [Mycena chlorophos]